MHDDSWLRGALAVKRDGGALEAATWTRIVAEYTAGTLDDAPVAALAMACTIRGMSASEIVALTEAMIASGESLRFEGNVVDKHSTGGVGDTVSLVAVPLVAACGVPVAKLSGRALGHTGGTLDKLEAIPGVRTDLGPEEMRAQVTRIGCAIAGQTAQLAPADKKLYALRDRTGSVPSIGLISASIVSKKIAAGAHGIVFDVKTGRGAFLPSRHDAMELARTLVDLVAHFGRRATALVTDMDEPLGRAIGTGLEAIEARDVLRGTSGDRRLLDVVRLVAIEMLRAGESPDGATERVDDALRSGAAYERFVALVEAQGGSRAALEQLAPAPEKARVLAERDGFVAAFDAVAIGEAARATVARGGPAAGIVLAVRVGTRVRRGDTLALLHGDDGAQADVAGAITIADAAPPPRPLTEATVRDAASGSPSKSRV